MTKPSIEILLAAPRGFCAGVDRAVKIVEQALERWGPPVYVRHEIVHNRRVVDSLRAKGAVFVEKLCECPDGRPVILSAHGVPKSVISEARRRNLLFVDATCPLVSKVHSQAINYSRSDRQIVMIGHRNHPETIGTLGQVPQGDVLLVESESDVASLKPRNEGNLAYVTQTTLSYDDTADIIAALQRRFPSIVGPDKDGVCYASTNRQEAVKTIAPRIDVLLVVGAPHSSNSRRLVEVGLKAGCSSAQLIQDATEIDWNPLVGISAVGVTAGASAPEQTVDEVLDALRQRFVTKTTTVTTAEEHIEFNLPRRFFDTPIAKSAEQNR